MTTKARGGTDRPGPEAIASIVKRYRKRDRQYVYGLQIRAYGERHWIPLGTEREGWNDVRAADRRNDIAALVRRGAWRPPNTFVLDPREKDPGFHEFATDWLIRYRRTVRRRSAESAEYLLRLHLLPFLHEYTLGEIDYALLSSYVAKKLEENEEIERVREAGITLRDRHGNARRTAQPPHDQHDTRARRPGPERRRAPWTDQVKPRGRPGAAAEGDAQAGELPGGE